MPVLKKLDRKRVLSSAYSPDESKHQKGRIKINRRMEILNLQYCAIIMLKLCITTIKIQLVNAIVSIGAIKLNLFIYLKDSAKQN